MWLFPEEVDVADHPTFQRLGRIYQLGQTYVVYRGATHKRLEHVLGAVQVVQRMIEAVDHNGRKPQNGGETRRRELREAEWRFIRLGALLHDIGHLAAGHTVEDELCLLGKHDADRRLDKIFESTDWLDEHGRTLSTVIDSAYAKYMPATLSASIKPSVLVRLLIRKTPAKPENDPRAEQENLAAAAPDFALQVCRDMIGNTICADLLDYIYRDWYHIGKPRPFDDRLLQDMEVRTSPGAIDRFVISTGRRPKIRTDAISAILELLESRYQLAESVLFHLLGVTLHLHRRWAVPWPVAAFEVSEYAQIVHFFRVVPDKRADQHRFRIVASTMSNKRQTGRIIPLSSPSGCFLRDLPQDRTGPKQVPPSVFEGVKPLSGVTDAAIYRVGEIEYRIAALLP